jgi:spore coat protein CotF
MASLLSGILGKEITLNNEVIANDMLAGAKAAASAYLTATLEAATPELKALYSGSLNEILAAHAGLTNLALNKDWYKPYEMPEQQLAEAFKQSVTVTNQ